MADLPRPSKYSKVGSNLKAHKALAAADQALRERRMKPFRRAERKFQRQRREILTKPVVRNAAGVFRQQRDAYNLGFLNANGKRVAIVKSRRRARAAIDRALGVKIPRFAEYEALRQQHALDYRRLVANDLLTNQGGAVGVQLGDGVLPDDVIFQPFTPPYELFDVTRSGPRSSDNSFAEPNSGNVVTDIQFHASGSAIDFNPNIVSDHRSSVGINFRVPKTGFLNCTATIQNVFNRFHLAVEDNFGFSSSELNIVHTIFVAIVRSGEVTRFERTMCAAELASDGIDRNFSYAPIPTSTPFTISFATRDAFLKGERIQILGGAALHIQTRVDDMESFVTALTMWQLKMLAVAVRT